MNSTDERDYLYWSTKDLLQGEKWTGLNGTFLASGNLTGAAGDANTTFEFAIE